MTISEEDDGSGWVKVHDGQGGSGLIPATYVEDISDGPPIPSSRPIPASGGTGKFGEYPKSDLAVDEGLVGLDS